MFRFFSTSRQNRPDIAIDFGTANTRTVLRDGGIVFEQPTASCFSNKGGKELFLTAGTDAYDMLDRASGGLHIRRPLARGVVQDLDAASAYLQYVLKSVMGRLRLSRPSAMVGIPADATKAEASALRTVLSDAGFGRISLVKETYAAAIGAGLDIGAARASMIIECGAGTTEIAVFSIDGECLIRSVRGGGQSLDEALIEHMRARHHFLIGLRTAERLKHAISRQISLRVGDSSGIGADPSNHMVEIKGRDLRTGLPATRMLSASVFQPVFKKHLVPIVEATRGVLATIKPDLAADLLSGSIIATGGCASISLLSEMITNDTGLPIEAVNDEALCVSRGLETLMAG
ncbi:rod shape-determining protein [Altericroceibacterium spongiae]|uniref:Rod shape-determining protein n=1 Tax=Altericroceibacterium spongiae TaxID=2320269 RepID=A0A420ENZ0_9SPHN|nr:rod shape-determining protein [Altericroceibacterium spongiae]RKF22394.1 rod shape-determining protein [Altericroceibacterium spongiae]